MTFCRMISQFNFSIWEHENNHNMKYHSKINQYLVQQSLLYFNVEVNTVIVIQLELLLVLVATALKLMPLCGIFSFIYSYPIRGSNYIGQ